MEKDCKHKYATSEVKPHMNHHAVQGRNPAGPCSWSLFLFLWYCQSSSDSRCYFPDMLYACSVRKWHFTVFCSVDMNRRRRRYIEKETLSTSWFHLHLEKYQEQSYSRQNCSW